MKKKLWDEEAYFSIEIIESGSSSFVVIVLLVTFFTRRKTKQTG